ncbi:hypothetical protein PILCRDRAFT_803132 [Piloderma croceum F 1598]|uniref:Major facilitator superfamily (MFS) profile domain-containing protein n=1 Tax=Piloderma croceum (strain F 1598) TaxID=765440 RepID=A0A0C3EK91_PILCF|nr:hypothetical protein PILCRDRAFT_803132 [Piloderma croceum F 1598]
MKDEESLTPRASVTASELNLTSNVEARIKNPLTGIPRHQLLRNVEIFAKEHGLSEEIPVLSKGAILAQSPADFETLDVLDDRDQEIIRYEIAHKWSHPWTLYMTVIICSIGAATQGWDQMGLNSANLVFPTEFSIPINAGAPNAAYNSWIVGVVNAAPYMASAVCGCWLSDPLNNYFGRRGTIFITALILIATPIASGFTHSWQTLFVVRLILGIGMGVKASTVPMYAVENSLANIRGALTAFGIFIGFATNVIVENMGKIAWRLQLGSAFIPAVPLAMFIFLCPESPCWLMKKNRYVDTYRSLLRIHRTPLQAARDLYYIHVHLIEESKIARGTNYFVRFSELFTIPRVRRATLAAYTVTIAQHMCGINIIAFYSSTVFSEAGYTNRQALYASLGFGAVNFLFAFPAVFTIDTFGRRSLLLFTFPHMAWTLLAAGLCFLINPDIGTARIGAIALFIFLFAAFYSPGEGPVPSCYSAEVFPLAQREQGVAFAATIGLGWASVLPITFPRMLITMTPMAFSFYAGLNVVAFVMIFFFVP